jgi:uncharacterized protein (DUF302 family)
MSAFGKNVAAANTFAELEKIVQEATGPSELMEFMRFIVGNPVTMSRMLQHVPDAGSYAPITILIDERPDGVHLSYDRMASFLAAYGNAEALKVARDLDSKVERLLIAAAK